jgi:hypothetical protein
LTPNPIRKVLSTLASHRVQHLLMGGQACVLYGAAEFSRDLDIALLADPINLGNLQTALEELQAECIAFPQLDLGYLAKGHAVHFRCHQVDADGMRLDVMSHMRGVDAFPQLWNRRTSISLDDGLSIEVLSLPDLVRAKKTQRDKDWPMIRRLVERHHATHRDHPSSEQVRFWLEEARTVPLLMELAILYPEARHDAALLRPLLDLAGPGNDEQLASALHEEEKRERDADRSYWLPLKKELEQLRLRRSSP